MTKSEAKPDGLGRAALLLVALTPIWFGLATFWLPIGTREGSIVREFGMPIFFAEILVVIIALLRVGLPDAATLKQGARWLVPALALIGVAFIAAGGPGDPDLVAMGYVRSAVLALNLAFLASLVALLRAEDAPGRLFVTRTLIAGMIGFTLILMAYVWTHWGEPGFDWRYLGLGGANVRNLSFYYSWAAPLIACLLVAAKERRHQAYLAIALITCFTVAFWSGTRSIPFAALAAALALLVTGRFAFAIRAIGAMLLAALIALAASMLFPAPDGHYSSARMVAAHSPATADVSAGRMAVWQKALDEIAEAPILGNGEARYEYPMSNIVIRHPHQFILQWLHAWGVIGTLLALGLLAAALWRLWRHAVSGHGLDMAIWGGTAALLAVAMIDGALFHPYPTMMVMLLLALGLARRQKSAG